jgi:hypothetical protein
MSEEWRAARLQGSGMDFTELTVWCPETGCGWEHTWDDTVTLDEVHDVLAQHMQTEHGE